MFQRILIVCVGNLCRSPMAAAVLGARLIQQGRAVAIDSAGILAPEGAVADKVACLRMAERGLDLSHHRARLLRPDMIRDADLILVMEEEQRRWLREVAPDAAGKTYLLGHWRSAEIADPYQQPPTAYDQAIALIDVAVDDWCERL